MAVKKFDLSKTTTEYLNKHESFHLWQRIVSILSCIVVFCTTYALIIPAITLEKKEPICGLEAHLHEEDCYIPLHVHTEDCYKPNGSEPYYSAARSDEPPTYCGYADFVIHEHDFNCYDEFGELICGLPQIAEHRHEEGDCVFAAAIESQFDYNSDPVYPINDPIDDRINDSITSIKADENEISAEYEAASIRDDSEISTNPQDIPVQDELPRKDSIEAVDDICILPEVEYHLHTSECFSAYGELICGMTQVLYRAYTNPNGETMVRVCGLTKHEHIDSCYPDDREPAYVIGTEYFCGIGEHAHTDTCYDADGYLVCTLPAHIHTDECLEPQVSHEDEYVCGMVAHLHIVDCFDENGELVCGISVHMHTAECLPPEYYCGLESHIHRFYSCYDEEGWLICELEEHEHDLSCMINPDAALDSPNGDDGVIDGEYREPEVQDEVEAMIEWIDNIPSMDEIMAAIAEFEASGDDDGLDVYIENLSSQVSFIFDYYYRYLTTEQQEQIINYDKLLDYSWMYVATLAITEDYTCNIYGVNHTQWTEGYYSVIYNEKNTSLDLGSWIGCALAPTSVANKFQIVKIYPEKTKKGTCEVPEGGFIHYYVTSTYNFTPELGTVVTVSGNFWEKDSTTSITPYGTLTYHSESASVILNLKEDKDNTNNLKVVNAAHTSDFIELNLYDYGVNINELYNQYKGTSTPYPGFQQNSGMTSGGTIGSYPNFGDNITTDLDAGEEGLVSGQENDINSLRSSSSILPGVIPALNGTATYKDSGANYSIATDPYVVNYPVMNKKLVDGYPQLSNDNSLKYLFSENKYATKMNKNSSIDGLFQYNPNTGVYTYDSRKNHAQFVAGTDSDPNDKFVLYDQIITPNYIMYAFGNFMPFNDIVYDSAPVNIIDKNYLQTIANTAGDRQDNINTGKYHDSVIFSKDHQYAYRALQTMLNTYINSFDTQMRAEGKTNWTIKDMAEYYYNNLSTIPIPPRRAADEDIYQIDYDEAKNFYFGMEMKLSFMQSKNGRTTKGLPMVLSFTGDDDVWFYIDDYLFLDLSGIHRQVGGQIDFEKGEVRYYRLAYEYGDVIMDTEEIGGVQYYETEPIRVVKFSEILSAEDAARLLNSKGTFKNYSFHTLNFYFMERGSGSSVCRLEFNMEQTIPTSIYKVDQYGDPIEGAKFAIYAADEDYNYIDNVTDNVTDENIVIPANIANLIPDPENGNLTYKGETVKPVYTDETNSEGAFEFLKDDNTYYSIGELEKKFGTHFILREYYIPGGYRTVSDEIRLYIENDTIQCANTYNSGAWASPNALVTASRTLVPAKDYSKTIQFMDSEGHPTGTLFAVILKRNDNPLPDNMDNWEDIEYEKWYPVYGSETRGYTVIDHLNDPNDNLQEVLDAAREAEKFGSICFGIGLNQMPQLVIENLPSNPKRYLTYILENYDNSSYNPEDGNDLQYVVAYYYTTAGSVAEATVKNTVRITSHYAENQNSNFSVTWGSTISIPNIENKYFIQKSAVKENPNDPDVFINNAVFAMYRADQDVDENVYYYASDGSKIYLAPDDDGDNRGRAGLSPGNYTGTYEIYTADIIIPEDHVDMIPFIYESAANGKITGGDIVVEIDGKTYIIKPAVNADHERLVSNSHDICTSVSEAGTAHFSKLFDGNYILREILSPSDYAINTTEIKVVVNGEGIYANAGTPDNDVLVGNGAGYLAATLENAATEGYIDETLTWIYTMLRRNNLDKYDVFNPDGSLDSKGFAAKNALDVMNGMGSDIVESKEDAMVTYLMYDTEESDADNDRQTLFDYFPNADQGKNFTNGSRSTKDGEGTLILFTDTGWSELAIYQDYYYGIKQTTTGNFTYYEDHHNENLTTLFSNSTFVRITDQRLNDLKVVKIDSDTNTTLSGAEFVLYRYIDGEKRYYQKHMVEMEDGSLVWNGTIDYLPLGEGQTAEDFAIRVDDRHKITVDGVEIENPDYGALHYEKLTTAVYYLEELTAPDGYKKLPIPIKITVDNGVVTGVDAGALDLFELDNGIESGDMVIYVKNNTSYTLPKTGTFGGTLTCTFGGLLLIAAPFVYTYRRRKLERRVKAR